NAASTVETWVFGSAPNSVAAPENSFERDTTWACTSSPITTSHGPVRPSIRLTISLSPCGRGRGPRRRRGRARGLSPPAPLPCPSLRQEHSCVRQPPHLPVAARRAPSSPARGEENAAPQRSGPPRL